MSFHYIKQKAFAYFHLDLRTHFEHLLLPNFALSPLKNHIWKSIDFQFGSWSLGFLNLFLSALYSILVSWRVCDFKINVKHLFKKLVYDPAENLEQVPTHLLPLGFLSLCWDLLA